MSGLLQRSNVTDDEGGEARSGAADSTIDVTGLPVVTLGGDDAAGIHDVVTEDGVTVYTLEKRSLFGGMLDRTLPHEHVIAIGPDAVIVADPSAFVGDDEDEPLTPSLRTGDASDEPPAAAGSPALFSEVRKRDVVAADTGETVGRVDRFVIDPVGRTVGSIRLDNVSSDVRFLSWRDVASFGEDVVTIATGEALRKPDGPRENGCRKDFRAGGKLVLTDEGHELGTCDDVEFDRADGRITALLIGDQRVAGSRLRGVGPYAVVVRA